MTPVPAVSCDDCGFAWNSATMAEGLRLLGSCPRCGGSLRFRRFVPTRDADPQPTDTTPRVAPHRVLGLPRRDTAL